MLNYGNENVNNPYKACIKINKQKEKLHRIRNQLIMKNIPLKKIELLATKQYFKIEKKKKKKMLR